MASTVALSGFFTSPTHAQFTGDNQTNIIDGTTANWPGYYYVGSNYVYDALYILNGGFLSSNGAMLGHESSASNNLAVVSGSGSIWTNAVGYFYVGFYGSFNRVEIRDGGHVRVVALNTVVGSQSSSLYNSALVTDTGSVWTISDGLWMGDGGAYCSLVISNGAAVVSGKGYVGGSLLGKTNIAVVTGTGSVWTNSGQMYVGYNGKGNVLIVSNGGAVFSTRGSIGETERAQGNSVLVTGTDSLWKNSGDLFIGFGNSFASSNRPADGNSLTIANGGSVLVASNAFLGFSEPASNSLLSVSGGNLIVTNVSSTGTIDVRRGRLAFNGGTITAERLWLTNGIDSILEFNSGILHSGGTVVSNAQPCIVGDSVASGNFHLVGGAHSFQNGLRIRNHSLLTGCGTVNGSVLVDAGAVVRSDCSTLLFSGNVTNNGAMVADGAVLESSGTLVNNGTIYLFNNGTTNFHGTFINNGSIMNVGPPYISKVSRVAADIVVQIASVPGLAYQLQSTASLQPPAWAESGAAQTGTGSELTFTDPGTTTNASSQFYRLRAQ